MLKNLNLVIILLVALNISKANQIDIGLFESQTVASKIEVKIRPDFNIQSIQTVSGILYTVRWADPSVSITTQYVNPFYVAPQGPPILYNGYYYQVFAAVPLTPVSINANEEFLISSFTFTNGECATFEIIEDEWTQANNGNVYLEFVGVEVTGIIYEPIVAFGSFGGNIEGNESIYVGNATGPMNLINHQGNILTWQRNIDESTWLNITGTAGQTSYSEIPPTIGSYSYRVQVQNEACPVAFSQPLNIQVITNPEIELNLKVYLEGAYLLDEMTNTLNLSGHIPLNQPYAGSPWNYNGLETLAEIPDSNVVDWVLVELRDASDPDLAISDTQISRQVALLLNNGSIVGLDGVSALHFTETINQKLFVVIWHRNHLGIMSANGFNHNPDGVYMLDFTTSQSYENGQKYLGSGLFGMISGDSNADGFINNSDINQDWKAQAGTKAYLSSDFNLNGQVNNQDKNDWLENNYNEFTKVPD